MRNYHRFKRFKIDELIPFIGEGPQVFEANDRKIKVKEMASQRMLLLKRDRSCACCLAKATHFWLEVNGRSPHFNLYGINEYGHTVMMTADHIVPKSKGGPNTLDNFQMLCEHCNVKKKNWYITLDDLLRIRFRPENFCLLHYIKRKCTDPKRISEVYDIYRTRHQQVKQIKCMEANTLELSSPPQP